MDHSIRQAAEILTRAQSLVVLTGAGVSTESGIPDFRSPGGIWSKYDPSEFTYQNFVANRVHRERYWKMSLDIHKVISAARPNAAHQAVAELERRGHLTALVTQNIDGLHLDAGTPAEKVIEIHGTSREVMCLSCDDRTPRDEIQERLIAGEAAPECSQCGGILKPATISFGQAMPEQKMALAYEHASNCDAFLVIGSSLVVYPAADLPVQATRAGAPLVIVNLEETPCDELATVIVRGRAGDMMQSIIKAMPAS